MTNILDLPTNIVAASRKSAANLAPRSDRTPHGSGSSASLAAQLDHLQLQLEHAQAMADQPPDLFLKAAMNIAAVDFFTVLNRFDTDALIKRLHEKPELYFQMINSYASLMKSNLDQQKFDFKKKQTEAKQRERDQKLRARKPILVTDTTLQSFGRTLARSRRREEADQDAPVPPVAPPSTEHLRTNTANTGPSQFVEFNALDHATEPQTQPTEIPTEGHHPSPLSLERERVGARVTSSSRQQHENRKHAWHDPAYQHSDDLVCSPS